METDWQPSPTNENYSARQVHICKIFLLPLIYSFTRYLEASYLSELLLKLLSVLLHLTYQQTN